MPSLVMPESEKIRAFFEPLKKINAISEVESYPADMSSMAMVYFYVISRELALLENKLNLELYEEGGEEPLYAAKQKLLAIRANLQRSNTHDFNVKLTLQQMAGPLSREFQELVNESSLEQGAMEYFLKQVLSARANNISDEAYRALFYTVALHYKRQTHGVTFTGIKALNSFLRNYPTCQFESPYTVQSYALSAYLYRALEERQSFTKISDRFDADINLEQSIPKAILEISSGLIERFIINGEGFYHHGVYAITPLAEDDAYLPAIDRAITNITSYLDSVATNGEHQQLAELREQLAVDLDKLQLIKGILTASQEDNVTAALFNYAKKVVLHLQNDFSPVKDLSNTAWLEGLSVDGDVLFNLFNSQIEDLERQLANKKASGQPLYSNELIKLFIDTIYHCALERKKHIQAKRSWADIEATQLEKLSSTISDDALTKSQRCVPSPLEICVTDFKDSPALLKEFVTYCLENGCDEIIIYEHKSKIDEAAQIWSNCGLSNEGVRFYHSGLSNGVLHAKPDSAHSTLIHALDRFGAYQSLRAFFAGQTNRLNLQSVPLLASSGFKSLPLWIDFSFSLMDTRLQEALTPESCDLDDGVEDFFDENVYSLLSETDQQLFNGLNPYYRSVVMQYVFTNFHDEIAAYEKEEAKHLLQEELHEKLLELNERSENDKTQSFKLRELLYQQALAVYEEIPFSKQSDTQAFIQSPYIQRYKRLLALVEKRFSGAKLSEANIDELMCLIKEAAQLGPIIKQTTGWEDAESAKLISHLNEHLESQHVNQNELFLVLVDVLNEKRTFSDMVKASVVTMSGLLKKLLAKLDKDYQQILAKMRLGVLPDDATVKAIKDWVALSDKISTKLPRVERPVLQAKFEEIRRQYALVISQETAKIIADIRAYREQGYQTTDTASYQIAVQNIHRSHEEFRKLFNLELHSLDLYQLNLEIDQIQGEAVILDDERKLAYLNRKVVSPDVRVFKVQYEASSTQCLEGVQDLLLSKAIQHIESCDGDEGCIDNVTRQLLQTTQATPSNLQTVYEQKVLLRQLHNYSCEPQSPISKHRAELHERFNQFDKAHVKAFLNSLKAHIEQSAVTNTYRVGLQWRYGKQLIRVNGQAYAVPRRVKMQYDLLMGDGLSDEKADQTLESVLAIGRNYKRTFFSSKTVATQYFTHFKSEFEESEDNQVYVASKLALT